MFSRGVDDLFSSRCLRIASQTSSSDTPLQPRMGYQSTGDKVSKALKVEGDTFLEMIDVPYIMLALS